MKKTFVYPQLLFAFFLFPQAAAAKRKTSWENGNATRSL